MEAVRQITKVKNGKISLKLPPELNGERVEVIVLPVKKRKKNSNSLESLLLKGPTFSEEELQKFDEVREWMNQWKIEEF